MWPPARMPQSPIRYDGVLARSLPQLARLGIASLPPPYARIWAPPIHASGSEPEAAVGLRTNPPSGRAHGWGHAVGRLPSHGSKVEGCITPGCSWIGGRMPVPPFLRPQEAPARPGYRAMAGP